MRSSETIKRKLGSSFLTGWTKKDGILVVGGKLLQELERLLRISFNGFNKLYLSGPC